MRTRFAFVGGQVEFDVFGIHIAMKVEREHSHHLYS